MIKICSKCSREITHLNLSRHERKCDGILKFPVSHRFTRAEMKGKTYEQLYGKEKADEMKLKISKGTTKAQKDPDLKVRHAKAVSEGMKQKYIDGWKPKCGRCKKIDYTSPIAGIISVDGSWELITAKYLDKLGVNWNRNTKRFEYTNLSGGKSTYCPDFYIEESSIFGEATYIEVKGYETELDRCKWSQFPEKLLVWKRQEIELMEV